MIIECHECESKVDAKVLAEHESIEEPFGPIKVNLLECPSCKGPILSYQHFIQVGPDEIDWVSPIRAWPFPEKYLSTALPIIVRNSMDQAKKCYKAKAYDACAVMCGKVLEGICSEYKIKNKALKGGLKILLDRQIIDKRIYDWGEALREHRNIGAHASDQKISKEDARYLLDFTEAICEYVFVLTEKFERFMRSKEKSKKEKK